MSKQDPSATGDQSDQTAWLDDSKTFSSQSEDLARHHRARILILARYQIAIYNPVVSQHVPPGGRRLE